MTQDELERNLYEKIQQSLPNYLQNLPQNIKGQDAFYCDFGNKNIGLEFTQMDNKYKESKKIEQGFFKRKNIIKRIHNQTKFLKYDHTFSFLEKLTRQTIVFLETSLDIVKYENKNYNFIDFIDLMLLEFDKLYHIFIKHNCNIESEFYSHIKTFENQYLDIWIQQKPFYHPSYGTIDISSRETLNFLLANRITTANWGISDNLIERIISTIERKNLKSYKNNKKYLLIYFDHHNDISTYEPIFKNDINKIKDDEKFRDCLLNSNFYGILLETPKGFILLDRKILK